jgi:hypothetical protein
MNSPEPIPGYQCYGSGSAALGVGSWQLGIDRERCFEETVS